MVGSLSENFEERSGSHWQEAGTQLSCKADGIYQKYSNIESNNDQWIQEFIQMQEHANQQQPIKVDL